MLIPLALDSDALSMSSVDLVQQRVIHKRFLQVWSDFGVFLHLEPFFSDSTLATKINKLPQDIKKLWEVAIKQNRRRELFIDLKDLANVTQLSEIEKLNDQIKLVCLDDVRALCVGIPDDKESIVVGDKNLEVCRFDFVDQSNHVKNAYIASSKNIPKDEKVDTVWANWFKMLAMYSTKIVIVDRYAVCSAHERRDGKSGLNKFLTEISKLTNPHNIIIYSARKRGCTDTQLVDSVKQHFASLINNGINTLNINLCDDSVFSEIAHYRYIKFDDTLCMLDTGLEVLNGDEVYRTCSFNKRKLDPLTSKEEIALRGNSSHITLK